MATLLACLTPLSAQADLFNWKTVNGWRVAIDPSMGHGCLIGGVFEDDILIRIGLNQLENVVYLTIGNREWKSIEAGKRYPVTLKLGRDSPWNAQALGGVLDDTPTLMVTTSDPAFVADFRLKRSIALHYQGKEIAALSLRGSSAAIDAMLDCQFAVNAKFGHHPRTVEPTPPKDPFKTERSRPAADPFRL